jgi:hypothetical protein
MSAPPDDPYAEGAALSNAGRYEDALAVFRTALAQTPDVPALHFNIGNTLRLLKQFAAAIEAYDAAIALRPDLAMAYHNRALCRLQLGDLPGGFRDYEWRKVAPTFDDPRYRLERPWRGEDLRGKTLFVYPELFLGDMLQFCRYAYLAERAGARVLLAAPQSMHAILRSMSPTIELLAEEATPEAYDYQCALMSLPLVFGTTVDRIPRAPFYLRAEPERVARWRERIGPEGFKIGVAWQGSTQPYALRLQRSFPLAALRAIAGRGGVRLISLQKINGLEQMESLPADMRVESPGDDFDCGPDLFLDTAAAMQACDLFITPDTSVAHLAGALGVPTWVALGDLADWRWFEGRSDSPWYPSVRLFRQTVRGDWAGVFADMAEAIAAR